MGLLDPITIASAIPSDMSPLFSWTALWLAMLGTFGVAVLGICIAALGSPQPSRCLTLIHSAARS